MRGLRTAVAVLALVTASPALAAKKPLGAGERIDVARASAAELMRLPGVGRKKADAIVAYRGRAPFHRVEDLLSVKGVSGRWLERQRPHLTVGAVASAKPVASAAVVPAKPPGTSTRR